jgi:hypothetical protein
MEKSKPVETPEELGKLSSVDAAQTQSEKLEMQKKPYRSAIGSLMYAAISTRPDLSHSVNYLSRFMNNYGQPHWKAVQRVIRYLNSTKDAVLKIEGKQFSQLVTSVYVDANWAGDLDDRKSTTGYVIKINNCIINWVSKKQTTIALSTADAEYMAMKLLKKFYGLTNY